MNLAKKQKNMGWRTSKEEMFPVVIGSPPFLCYFIINMFYFIVKIQPIYERQNGLNLKS